MGRIGDVDEPDDPGAAFRGSVPEWVYEGMQRRTVHAAHREAAEGETV